MTVYKTAREEILKDWQAMKELLSSGSQTEDNYEIWKTIRPSVTKAIPEDQQLLCFAISLLNPKRKEWCL